MKKYTKFLIVACVAVLMAASFTMAACFGDNKTISKEDFNKKIGEVYNVLDSDSYKVEFTLDMEETHTVTTDGDLTYYEGSDDEGAFIKVYYKIEDGKLMFAYWNWSDEAWTEWAEDTYKETATDEQNEDSAYYDAYLVLHIAELSADLFKMTSYNKLKEGTDGALKLNLSDCFMNFSYGVTDGVNNYTFYTLYRNGDNDITKIYDKGVVTLPESLQDVGSENPEDTE